MSETEALRSEGIDALRRGDATRARGAFERAIGSGQADAALFLGLAYACRGEGDAPATLAAVDRALALEPRNLRGLVLKGDLFAARGDDRAAASFYTTAMKSVPDPQRLSPELRAELARAQAACQRYAAALESELRERIGPEILGRPSSRRFAESLDILLGKKSIYVQEPAYYYFPGLPAIAFHDDRERFAFLDELEAATPAIREEVVEVLGRPDAFRPYIESDPRRPRSAEAGLADNADWSAFYLWKDGAVVRENAARCPATMRALEKVPLCRVPNRSPTALFSLLRAGAHIPPHAGMVNTRLIAHLPLIVPPGCTFRVGNETRDWVEGRAWVFDDTIEHEAWNRSAETRVILLFDLWTPDLSVDERELVGAIFQAIDARGGTRAEWDA
jgi:aspartyl/asparaginyl beta-hydroxylase (cupin superfamily)